MKPYKFLFFFILEVLSIILAVFIFKNIESKNLAGLIAGSQFLALGLYVLISLLKSSQPFKFFTFYGALSHIFLTTIPMLFLRLSYWNTDFKELSFLSFPTENLHKFSEKVFLFLMLCTLLDFILVKFFKSK